MFTGKKNINKLLLRISRHMYSHFLANGTLAQMTIVGKANTTTINAPYTSSSPKSLIAEPNVTPHGIFLRSGQVSCFGPAFLQFFAHSQLNHQGEVGGRVEWGIKEVLMLCKHYNFSQNTVEFSTVLVTNWKHRITEADMQKNNFIPARPSTPVTYQMKKEIMHSSALLKFTLWY